MQSDECIPDTVWLTTSALSAMPTCTQNVEEEPLTWWSSSSYVGRQPDQNVEEVYSESHRLAVEELVAGGIDAYYAFLTKERVRNFLSDDEIEFILHTAVPHESPPQPGDSSSYVLHDTTSLAYFPNVSDIEAPTLDIGWPELNPYKLRGPTTSVAHFHPNYAAYTPVERIYTCKEAARRMIKSAKEAIAIVTDNFTDLDIFRDLQEACSRRRVPVYILLDQEAVPAFLQMCKNSDVRLAELQKMRVRAVAGFRYFTRSGVRITGRVHEQFMLVDGKKVAMGTYRFRWTDGRINTCNLIELTGEVTEQYEQEFQRLFKKSLAINTKATLPPQGPQVAPLTRASLSPTKTPTTAPRPNPGQGLGVLLTSIAPVITPPPAAPAPALPNPPAAPRAVMRTTSTQTLKHHLTQGTQTTAPKPAPAPAIPQPSTPAVVRPVMRSTCTQTLKHHLTQGTQTAPPAPAPVLAPAPAPAPVAVKTITVRRVVRTTGTQTCKRLLTQGTQTAEATQATPAMRTPLTSLYQPPRVVLSSVSSTETDSDSACSTPTETVPAPLLQTKASLCAKTTTTCPTQVTSYTLRLTEQNTLKDKQQQPEPKSNYSGYSTLSTVSNRDWSSLSIISTLHKGCKVQQNMRPGPGLHVNSKLMVAPIRSRFLQ